MKDSSFCLYFNIFHSDDEETDSVFNFVYTYIYVYIYIYIYGKITDDKKSCIYFPSGVKFRQLLSKDKENRDFQYQMSQKIPFGFELLKFASMYLYI